MNYRLLCCLVLAAYGTQAQQIQMEFPAFAGKTYDWVLFQGSKSVTVVQDTIPPDGKFTLVVPAAYAPYTGMCRWLITNSEQGGGLDMAIPGHDFAVSCLSDKPDNDNIRYTGADPVNELNRLYARQQSIIDRYEVMNRAVALYTKGHPLYAGLVSEKVNQQLAYEGFQQELAKTPSYSARFMPIVNLINGRAHRLTDDETEKGKLFNEFLTEQLNFKDLYVSGHWEQILLSWVMMHVNTFEDKSRFAADFKKISDRITSPAHYTDFAGKITYILNKYGKDDYIQAIAHTVLGSGKVTDYLGSMEVYQKAMAGMQAPALVLPNGKKLKTQELAKNGYEQTLLLFFDTGCSHCEEAIKQLKEQYKELQAKKIRLMTFAADADETAYQEAIKSYPWQENYADFKGMGGENFKNYAVPGTPTLFLLDKNGVILKKSASLADLLSKSGQTPASHRNSK